ncbi:MAG: hypothetical protein U0521_07730 [Anaerolineae bacterium]
MIDSLRASASVASVDAIADAELIVNCTSAGMQPKVDECPGRTTRRFIRA